MLALLVLAGCGSSTEVLSTPTPVPTPTPTPATPKPTGPATAQFTFAGTGGESGAVTKPLVRCFEPGFNGDIISVQGTAPDGQATATVNVDATQVTVRLSQGNGNDYTERDFKGSGATGFDASSGATVSTRLSETTAATLAKGTLGAITSVAGTISCGDQQRGTSTISVTGTLPPGVLSGPLSPVRVECQTSPGFASHMFLQGLARAGSTPVELVVTIAADAISVLTIPKDSSGNQFYQGNDKGSASFSGTTGHASGDVVLSGGTQKLHVSGDATCGSTAQI